MPDLYPKIVPRRLSEGQKHEKAVKWDGAGGGSLFPYIGFGKDNGQALEFPLYNSPMEGEGYGADNYQRL